MIPVLEQTFSEIEKGAEERLEAVQSEKERMQRGEASMETFPQIIGHVEKVEEEETPEQPEQPEGEQPAAEKGDGGGLMAGEQPNVAEQTGGEQTKHMDKGESVKTMDKAQPGEGSGSGKKQRSTPSISRMKEERKRAKIKEQEK